MFENKILCIAVMAVCVVLSAYFSATETAFSSLSKTRVKAYAEKGKKKADLVLSLSEKYDKLISTILIGNNIVNIILSSLGAVLFVELLGPNKGTAVSTLVVTVVVLIFGEITPKSVAKDRPENFAMFSAPVIRLFVVLLTPLNWLFSLWKKLVSKVLKSEEEQKMSQEELLLLVEEVQQEGGIDVEEGSLLRNAIEFSELKAEDILTHRVDLEAVSIEDSKQEIARVFSASRFSRLPLYGESIDDIIGIIHQKDFYVDGGITPREIRDIAVPPLFIYQSEKISDLLKRLQQSKSHVAIVLDEYGGTLGIVTMEDILEELVGEIWDEHDEVIETYKETDHGSYIVDCTVNLDDFARFFDTEIESDSISLGGWITEMLEKIPVPGDAFEFELLSVTVTELDSHRVAFAEVFKREPEEKEEDDD
ncbi:MAG: HlyC/CorC family transporter [Clostridia bacterium]|nr:HlyC/CorC family transporter [Clostridia bacterium]